MSQNNHEKNSFTQLYHDNSNYVISLQKINTFIPFYNRFYCFFFLYVKLQNEILQNI